MGRIYICLRRSRQSFSPLFAAQTAARRKPRPCRQTLASFSTTARAAARSCVLNQATDAFIAPTALCPVLRSNWCARAEIRRNRAAADKLTANGRVPGSRRAPRSTSRCQSAALRRARTGRSRPIRVTIAPARCAVDRIVLSEPGSRFCSELTHKGRSTMEFERQDVQADARVHTCEQVHRGRRRTDHTNVPADIRRRDVLRGSRGRRRLTEFEILSAYPHPMHYHGKLPGDGDTGAFEALSFRNLDAPGLQG